jgi:hypothetical protein
MSETISFGNLVNALNSVRDDYSEHLKAIPQYEAFLSVENSAQKVLETLQGLVNPPALSTAAEVISSLELAKIKFKEHLKSVPEYRALLAIEKLISDVSIDLGVQPAPAQTALPKIEMETPPQEIAPARSEPDPAVIAAVHPTTQPEAAEIATLHEAAATEPEPDFVLSAVARLVSHMEVAEIAVPKEVAATEADLAVSAAIHPVVQPEAAEAAAPQEAATIVSVFAVSAAEHMITQAEVAEIASPQEEAASEADLAASEAKPAITRPEAAEITATPLPAPPLMMVRRGPPYL